MRKGIQKNMIFIRTPDSRRYEAAYLILRPNPRPLRDTGGVELWQEAERILSSADPKTSSAPPSRRWWWFLGGIGTGGLLSLLAGMIIRFASS